MKTNDKKEENSILNKNLERLLFPL